ncbi:MAG TPA: 50S ribosomal protein L9 [Candidatus Fraserbacteria bacterium]|nr:50S ribosomal protein L9 [Candidatus Fraserbacteria bacterium]
MKKRKTEVMLTRPIERLGEPGDVVSVAPGYARNYLLPQGLAVPPTPHNVQGLHKVREARLIELRNREEQAKALQEQLQGQRLAFYRKVHEEGKLYSSVRLEEITARLSEQFGADIEKGKVQLAEPIEALGLHTVKVGLYKDISAEIQVEVLDEAEQQQAPAPEAKAEE